MRGKEIVMNHELVVAGFVALLASVLWSPPIQAEEIHIFDDYRVISCESRLSYKLPDYLVRIAIVGVVNRFWA